MDVVSVHERPELEGEPNDREVLRAATGEQRVLISNNAEHPVPMVDEFGLAGEDHFGVLLTSDHSMPRSRHSSGLNVTTLTGTSFADTQGNAVNVLGSADRLIDFE